MKSKKIGLRFMLSAFSLMLVLISTDSIGAIRSVPQDYVTIQSAIDAADSGDIVQVESGTYHESIVMKDGVVIQGASAEDTIIDGDGSWAVVTGANGEINGFTIRNGGTCVSYGEQEPTSPIIANNILKCGIGVGGYVPYHTGPISPIIRNNLIFVDIISPSTGQAEGIYLSEQAFAYGGVNAVIENNTIIDTSPQTATSVGIHLRMHKSLPTIRNNIVVGCWRGIEFTYDDLFEERKSLIWHNDVWNNGINYTVTDPSQEFEMTGIQGNISTNPLFVAGYYGDYYLGQTAAGQVQQSPCVDAGSTTAASLGLDNRTTRTDSVLDSGVVDIGYHYEPSVIGVSIDIKPNIINIKAKRTIPVTILSTETFDAYNMVDLDTITFGRTGDEDSLAFCKPSHTDVNRDGYHDLVCYFYTQLTSFQCGDIEGILKGQTVTSIPIKGRGLVRIAPCK